MERDYAFPDIQGAISLLQDDEPFRNSTFFITGATGLIGSVLVKTLLYLNDLRGFHIRIVALIRRKEKAEEVFGGLVNRKELKLLVQDVTQKIAYDGEIDYIIHTASPTSSKFFVTNPVETITDALYGTKNILELGLEKKAKAIVYLSSMEAFGTPDPDLKQVTETDLGYIDISSVRSSYSEGKRICELLCVSYADEYGVPVRIARLAQTFGAAVQINEGRVFAQFAKHAIEKTDIVLHTDGKSEGNYCYTGDAVSAIFLLLTKGVNGEAYTVCNEETNITIAGMAQMVAEKFGEGKVGVVFDIPEDARMYGYAPPVKMKLSSSKLRALGWTPTTGLEEMYSRLISSFTDQMKHRDKQR